MTEMRIKELDKWIHQNNGEVIDIAEGSLIDNIIIDCKRGTCFIFEEYKTEWTSAYHAFFFPEKEYNSADYNTTEYNWYIRKEVLENESV